MRIKNWRFTGSKLHYESDLGPFAQHQWVRRMEVEIKKIPRHVIHPLVIINNSEFGSFKRQSVMVNAVQLFTGFRKATKMQFTYWVPKSCFFQIFAEVRKVNLRWEKRLEQFRTYPIYFLCLLTGTKYSSYESSFVVPVSTSPAFFAGKSLLLWLPFVAVGFFALLLLLIFINSKLTASGERKRKTQHVECGC